MLAKSDYCIRFKPQGIATMSWIVGKGTALQVLAGWLAGWEGGGGRAWVEWRWNEGGMVVEWRWNGGGMSVE